jgi:hypothetical protein
MKFNFATGWQPRVTLEEGLAKMLPITGNNRNTTRMRAVDYEFLFNMEEHYWWFVAMRRIGCLLRHLRKIS